MIMEDIRKNNIILNGEITLYHGSREGIHGKIKPCSRKDCDFGTGFYLGTNPRQVKGLITAGGSPMFYELRVDLTKLRDHQKLSLTGTAWLCTILAYRCEDPAVKNIPAVQEAREKAEQADLIAVIIADDRMNEALRRFMSNGLSDAALLQCLQSVDYGYQYVLKTEKACSCADVIKSQPLIGLEKQQASKYSNQKRNEAYNIVNRMAGLFNREGHMLYEIIENPEFLQIKRRQDEDQIQL